MENLIYTVLGAFIGWLPPMCFWIRDRFISTGASRITFLVRERDRREQVTFKCKIPVEITNALPGAVRMTSAYFVFDKKGPLNADPKWPSEHGTGKFLTHFYCPPKNSHDWTDVFLRSGEKTDIWIGIDPTLPDDRIKQAAKDKNIGTLYFQMTQWRESGTPYSRWIRVKL